MCIRDSPSRRGARRSDLPPSVEASGSTAQCAGTASNGNGNSRERQHTQIWANITVPRMPPLHPHHPLPNAGIQTRRWPRHSPQLLATPWRGASRHPREAATNAAHSLKALAAASASAARRRRSASMDCGGSAASSSLPPASRVRSSAPPAPTEHLYGQHSCQGRPLTSA